MFHDPPYISKPSEFFSYYVVHSPTKDQILRFNREVSAMALLPPYEFNLAALRLLPPTTRLANDFPSPPENKILRNLLQQNSLFNLYLTQDACSYLRWLNELPAHSKYLIQANTRYIKHPSPTCIPIKQLSPKHTTKTEIKWLKAPDFEKCFEIKSD